MFKAKQNFYVNTGSNVLARNAAHDVLRNKYDGAYDYFDGDDMRDKGQNANRAMRYMETSKWNPNKKKWEDNYKWNND